MRVRHPTFFDKWWERTFHPAVTVASEPKQPGLVARFITNRHRDLAQRHLEKKIGEALELADGHRDQKIPRGDSRYQSLCRIVNDDIGKFCRTWDVPLAEIEAQVPGLKMLQDMATPTPPTQRSVFRIIFAPVAVLLLIAMLSCGAGVVKVIAVRSYAGAQWLMRSQ